MILALMVLEELRSVQKTQGAIVDHDNIAVTFNNDEIAYESARSGVALHDQSHWNRIEVSDQNRLDFLHNQSTNGFKLLKPGETCDTTFLTSTARTIDLATALILDNTVQLLISPGMAPKLITFLDRFIFFSDRVKLTDITATTTTFCLIGPTAATALQSIGILAPESGYINAEIGNTPVQIIAGCGLGIPGYRLVMAVENAAIVWKILSEIAVILGDRTYQRLRIEQGRPMPGFELTDDYNPLDAGLWNTISFNKGCYIGQETIARLDTYNGVKLNLWGMKLSSSVALGSVVYSDDTKVGTITSTYEFEDGSAIAIGYIRVKAGGAGLVITVESQTTMLEDLAFQVRHKAE
ncbi:MAG: folate-binding protein [Alkalinema sp. CAN_BIN05]|nr:folate-binding protein [Alkalinema sp. CAN_BIN05]